MAVLSVSDRHVADCIQTIESILSNNPHVNVLLCVQTASNNFIAPSQIRAMCRVHTHTMRPTKNPLAAIIDGLRLYPTLPMISVLAGINYNTGCLGELLRLHETFPSSICTAAFSMIKVSRKGDMPIASVASIADKRKDTNLSNKYYKIVCPYETLYPALTSESAFPWAYEELADVPMGDDTAYIFMSIVCTENDVAIRHIAPAIELPSQKNIDRALRATEDHYDTIVHPTSHEPPMKPGRSPDDELEVTVVTSTKNRIATLVENDPSRKFFFVDEHHATPNIDRFNPWFCELTALYHLHKNSTATYVGLEHYRRCFVQEGHGWYDTGAYRILDKRGALNILNDYDAIVAFHRHTPGRRAYDYLDESGLADAFSDWLDIVEDGTPGFKQFCNKILQSNVFICCNMFIATKELIDRYCEWLFDNIRRYVEIHKLQDTRLRTIGYLAEFTFGSWLRFNRYRTKLQPHIRFSKELTELEDVERTTLCMEEWQC